MKKKKCPHCRLLFPPDARNGSRQKFCCKTPECRKASKKDSQKRWLEKPDNQDYFRCPENCERVEKWRNNHPGYSRTKSSKKISPLQDVITPEPVGNKPDIPKLEFGPLQDIINAQPIVLLGLIANITADTLQDSMANTVRCLIKLGLDIINHPSNSKGGYLDSQNPHLSSADTKDTQTLQLAGSPPGA